MAMISETINLRTEIDNLRRRATSVGDPATLGSLLDEARALLKQAFQTDQEEAARTLFRELRERSEAPALMGRQGTVAAPANRRESLAARLRNERLRLSSSMADEAELAVDGLYAVLRELGADGADDGLRAEALTALETAAGMSDQLRRQVVDLLDSPGLLESAEVKYLLERIRNAPAEAAHIADARPLPPSGLPSPEIAQRLAYARRLFYAGDYFEAADVLTEILRLEPDNQEARDRLAQVEDNIRRGIVPDSRVPFEARAAFGRAQSLERAGRFEEAQASYRLALDEARKGGPLLENWLPAVEALLRVDNSIIAREMRDEGDALLLADRWREAVEKYEIVLRLLPDDAHARERLNLLRRLQEQTETVRAQLSLPAGRLADTGQAINALLQTIRDLRPKLPDSQRLADLEAEIAESAQAMRGRIVERSQQLISQARFLPNVSECKRMMTEALGLLEQAPGLAAGDGEAYELVEGTRAELARLEQAEADLAEARRLVNLNTDTARRQARDLLRSLREYDQDPTFLLLAANLQRQYLDQANAALRQRQLRVAEQWLSAASEEPFRALGSSDEAENLDRDLAAARRRPWIRLFGWGGGLIALLLLLGGLTRPLWLPAFLPKPTPTATGTPPPTEIRLAAETTPTNAPLPTLTPTPTATPTITPTPLPSATPTEAPRYGAINKDTAARLSPDGGAPWAFTLRLADPVQVLEEYRDDEGRFWYKILYIRGDSTLIGWAQARDINVQPTPSP